METILVCHRGALGDFILTWKALTALRTAYPGCRITALGRPDYLELAADAGIVDSGHNAESSVMLPFFAGTQLPPVLTGFTRAFLWLADGAPAAALLGNAGTTATVLPPFPDHGTEHVAAFHARNMARALGPDLPEPVPASVPARQPAGPVVIHPGSGSTDKNYAPYLYADMAETFAKGPDGRTVTIILGPVEQGLKHAFTGRGLTVVRPGTTKDLARTLREASLYIGNDSGPSHLAGYLGIPTIALYRTTDPGVWGVTGPRVRNLSCRTEDAVPEKVDLAAKELLNCA